MTRRGWPAVAVLLGVVMAGCADHEPIGRVTVLGMSVGGSWIEGAALVVALADGDDVVAQWGLQPGSATLRFVAFDRDVPAGAYDVRAWYLDCMGQVDCTQLPEDRPEEVDAEAAGWPPEVIACEGRIDVEAGTEMRLEASPLIGEDDCLLRSLPAP